MLFQKPNKVRDGGFSRVRILLCSIFFLSISLCVVDVEVAFGQTEDVTYYRLNVESVGASNVEITDHLHPNHQGRYDGHTNYFREVRSGMNVVLYAPWRAEPDPLAPGFHSLFEYWDRCDDVSDNRCLFRMVSDRTVKVYYGEEGTRTLYTLRIGHRPHSNVGVRITASPASYSGQTRYHHAGIAPGTNITLTAPNEMVGVGLYYYFSHWNRCDSTSSVGEEIVQRICTITMLSEDTNLVPVYVRQGELRDPDEPRVPRVVTVRSVGATNVPIRGLYRSLYSGYTDYSVTVPSDSEISLVTQSLCPTYGEVCTMRFSHWEGCKPPNHFSNNHLCYIDVISDMAVTAHYEEVPPPRTPSPGGGTPPPGFTGHPWPGDSSSALRVLGQVNESGGEFSPNFPVTITSDPPGFGGATGYAVDSIANGTTITLYAPVSVTRGGQTYSFRNWYGCEERDIYLDRSCTFPINSVYSREVRVLYGDEEPWLTDGEEYGDDPPGGGTPGPGGGTNHTLQIQSNQLGAVMTVTQGTSCITAFSAGGVIRCSNRTIPAGTTVTITAAQNAGGNTFSAWTGCDSPATDRTCSIVMSSDKTVSAAYGAAPPPPPTACSEAGFSCRTSSECRVTASGFPPPDSGGCDGWGQVCCQETFDGDSCEVGGRSGTCRIASECSTLNPGVGLGVCNSNSLTSNFVCCFPASSGGGPPLLTNPRDFENPTINIVPCGLKTYVNYLGSGPDGGVQYFDECTICHLQVLAMNLLAFLLVVGLVFAALLFANAGILYATASASASNIAKAHKLFLGTLIGLVLVLVAYALIDVMMKMLLPGDDGNVNGFGPWNTILCPAAGPTTQYTVPGISPVVTTVTGGGGSERPPVTLPQTCQGFGGTCREDLLAAGPSCGDSETNRGVLDCGGGYSCCAPRAAGGACRTDAGVSGVCLTASGCTTGNSGPSTSCGTGFVCCTPSEPVPGTGLCSVDNLRRYSFPENQLSLASCICREESSGAVAAASGVDKCQPDGFSVSHGLFQINLSAHSIGGFNCPRYAVGPMYTSSNRNCSIKNQAVWEQCLAAARNPDININKALELSKSGTGWRQWGAYSKCR